MTNKKWDPASSNESSSNGPDRRSVGRYELRNQKRESDEEDDEVVEKGNENSPNTQRAPAENKTRPGRGEKKDEDDDCGFGSASEEGNSGDERRSRGSGRRGGGGGRGRGRGGRNASKNVKPRKQHNKTLKRPKSPLSGQLPELDDLTSDCDESKRRKGMSYGL